MRQFAWDDKAYFLGKNKKKEKELSFADFRPQNGI